MLFLLLKTEIDEAKRTEKVVIFIPPAVDPGAPPIIIKNIIMSRPTSLITPISTVFIPAVLGVTAWKREMSILSLVS